MISNKNVQFILAIIVMVLSLIVIALVMNADPHRLQLKVILILLSTSCITAWFASIQLLYVKGKHHRQLQNAVENVLIMVAVYVIVSLFGAASFHISCWEPVHREIFASISLFAILSKHLLVILMYR